MVKFSKWSIQRKQVILKEATEVWIEKPKASKSYKA